jgi:hypothetical protein
VVLPVEEEQTEQMVDSQKYPLVLEQSSIKAVRPDKAVLAKLL